MINRDSIQTARAAAVLTTSYVAGTAIATHDDAQLTVYVDFTLGSLTSAQLKFEFSPDNGANWYQDAYLAVSAGTATATLGEITLAASGKYRFSVPVSDGKFRIQAKGTGTVTASSMKVEVQEANA